jgi:formylglycine-generating enzyme required for sulfatase activity
MSRVCLVLLALLASAVSNTRLHADATGPGWIRFHPDLVPSAEGFRDGRWGTRVAELPWRMQGGHVHTRYQRLDEDYRVFGVTAEHITYTTRNSVLYGVRIDVRGEAVVRQALAAARAAYPPIDSLRRVDDRTTRWQTHATSLSVSLPEQPDGLGQVCLWGRDRVFPDDSPTPAFLNPPTALDSAGPRYRPRRYVIYRTSAPITVDGHLDDKAWQDAEWTEPFEDAQSPYSPLPWKTTRAKVLHDDQALYVAAQLQEENVWAQIAKRDTISYWDNDFEFFVDPTGDGVDYFEFEMTALNQMFDMWHENSNHRNALADGRYDAPGLRHAVQVQGTLNYHYDTDDGWTVELMLPYTDMATWNPRLRVPPQGGEVWRLNFSRVQYLHVYTQLFPYLLPFSPCEDWVWAATFTGDLHVPDMWGWGVFSDLPAGPVKDTAREAMADFAASPPTPGPLIQDMVLLPACRVAVGPDPTDPEHSPAHMEEVPAFWIDRREVTVDQYAAFLNQGGHDQHYHEMMQVPELNGLVQDGPGRYRVLPGRGDHPVVLVTQEDAAVYAASLGKALPTEAMWERAARGTEGRTFPWGDAPITPERANYDFHYGGTLPAGSLPAGDSPEGVSDLAGNVSEWTASLFTPYPGGAAYAHWFNPPFFSNPLPEKRWGYVVRGGSWTSQPGTMASAYRDGHAMHNTGFRCVRPAP